MDNDRGLRLALFQAGNSADVIHVRMGAGDRLELELVPVNGPNNLVGVIAGVDADGPPGLLATHDAGVLLESRNRDLFDDHLNYQWYDVNQPTTAAVA